MCTVTSLTEPTFLPLDTTCEASNYTPVHKALSSMREGDFLFIPWFGPFQNTHESHSHSFSISIQKLPQQNSVG